MGKYAPLGSHLRAQSAQFVRMSFAEIERVLGFRLPGSARTHRAWWSNNVSNNIMTREWVDAGYRSEQVDPEGGSVVFAKESTHINTPGFEEQAAMAIHIPLYGSMKGTVRIAPGADPTEPADVNWGNGD